MQLKRLYDLIDPKKDRDPSNLRLVGVSVKHTGVSREQNFGMKMVSRAINEGWMSVSKGRLTIHAKEGALHYEIKRTSGYYCCHCGERLAAGEGLAHIEAKHKGVKSPDANNPSGYRMVDGYETVLEAEMHEKLKASRPFEGVPTPGGKGVTRG